MYHSTSYCCKLNRRPTLFYQVTVRCEGNAIVYPPYEVRIDPYILQIKCDEKNNLKELSVRKRVLDYESYLPKLTKDGDRKHTLRIPINPHQDDVTNLLQYIESLGSIYFSIKKVHWDTPIREWIPENDVERQHVPIGKIAVSQEYPASPTEMFPQEFLRLIQNRDKLRDLIIPLSFYREGKNAFNSFQYINAFFNFYFFLEGLFADGKCDEKLVVRKFRGSSEIKQAVEITLKSFRDPSCAHHSRKLNEFCISKKCAMTDDGIIELIVKMRGTLHHYSVKSSQKLGHPLNQQEFETMAYLLMSISTWVAIHLITQRLTPLNSEQIFRAAVIKATNNPK